MQSGVNGGFAATSVRLCAMCGVRRVLCSECGQWRIVGYDALLAMAKDAHWTCASLRCGQLAFCCTSAPASPTC